MKQAQQQLAGLLKQHPVTSGMLIRIHGDHLILGRRDTAAPQAKPCQTRPVGPDVVSGRHV